MRKHEQLGWEVNDYGARGERTVTALETVPPELDRRGFRVVTLSELLDLQSTDE